MILIVQTKQRYYELWVGYSSRQSKQNNDVPDLWLEIWSDKKKSQNGIVCNSKTKRAYCFFGKSIFSLSFLFSITSFLLKFTALHIRTICATTMQMRIKSRCKITFTFFPCSVSRQIHHCNKGPFLSNWKGVFENLLEQPISEQK